MRYTVIIKWAYNDAVSGTKRCLHRMRSHKLVDCLHISVETKAAVAWRDLLCYDEVSYVRCSHSGDIAPSDGLATQKWNRVPRHLGAQKSLASWEFKESATVQL
jgi:hypothetical protein